MPALRPLASRLALAGALAGCATSTPPLHQVPSGTWGGADAGMVVRDDGAHVHVGCTRGDIAGGIPVDDAGRFDVPAIYDVDAFPVDRGIRHPARVRGRTDGRTLTFTVLLTDTGQTLESGVLVLGREPRMVNCPICR